MKISNSFMTQLIVATVLFSVGFACSIGDDGKTANSGKPPPNNLTVPQNTPAPAPKNISGDYETTGMNPNGGSPYKASLIVTPRDDVYQFSWTSGSNKYDGVGVMRITPWRFPIPIAATAKVAA